MCTVTFVPTTSGYFLTSNRDEKNTRSKAFLPAIYSVNGVELMFPKDGDAGGSWIVLKENGDSLCLLNGAFENFIDRGTFTVSRGKIVIEIAQSVNLIDGFKNISLNETAPFTLIIVNEKKLFECRWDGEKKYCKALANTKAHIWSSATLYTEIQQSKREDWFSNWRKDNPHPSQQDLIYFHTSTGEGNIEEDLIINRSGAYFTVSITSIAIHNNSFLMQYEDLIYHDSHSSSFTQERANA
jgi:hypothetical protein